MIKRVHILLLYFCIAIICYGQEGKIFTADKELSSSMINSVYQDKKGVVWIATEDGLNRYDAAKFTVYKNDPQNENTLKNNYARIMFEDSKDNFYVGTLTGLQLYDRACESFTTIPMKFTTGDYYGNANISSIIERKNGDIVIGTSGHGIFIINPAQAKKEALQQLDLVPSYLVDYVYEDHDETLWIVTPDKGIFHINKNKKISNYNSSDGIIWPSSICEDNKGDLYIGCLKNGLFRYDRKQKRLIHISYNKTPLPIKTLYPIENKIYIGTDGNGLKIYNTEKQTIEEGNINTASFDFKKSKVHSILKDKQGNIWLGLFQKGVMIVPTIINNFNYIGYKSSTQNIIGSSCVMSVCQSHDGTLWVGTDNDGIYGISPNASSCRHFTPSSDSHSVSPTLMSIYEDSQHDLWLGSYRDGLAKMNPHNGHCDYVKLKLPNGEKVQSVYSIVEDSHQQLWIGTMGTGLYRISLKTGEIYTCPSPQNGLEYRSDGNMLHNRWINCLLHTRNDKLYIGTYDGLGCLDIPTMNFATTYKVNRLLTGEVIYALYEDAEGLIWIGTAQGLRCLTPATGEIKEYGMKDGLPSNSISAIKGDSEDHLWISTNFGISHFDKKANNFVNFYASDGLQGNEFTKGTAFATENKLIFGGTGGVTIFDPLKIINHNKKPEIRIADFYIHDRQVRLGMKSGRYDIVKASVPDATTFHLSHKDNSFSIEFSAMEFYSPERISYAYSFNNSHWVNLQQGSNRVSFSDLAPGKYKFQVKSKDYNSYSDIKAITIIISPPWYSSWWAQIIYVIIVCAVIGTIAYQVRQRYIARQKMLEHIHNEQLHEAKLQFFINISHEIRTPMSLIISPLQKLITNDTDETRQQTYKMIYRNAERILHLVNQLMDIRKIDKGQMQLKFHETDIVSFIRDQYQTFEYQANAKHIEFIFQPDFEMLNAWIDPKNFDKIILNVLSNAFKFTPENGKISIYLHTGEDPESAQPALRHYFEIIIEDTGIGIKQEDIERIFDRFYQIRNSQTKSTIGSGIGLHLTRSLVELHHGIIMAENNVKGPGCHFIIRLPIGRKHLKAEEIDDTPSEDIIISESTSNTLPAGFEYEEENDKNKPRTKTKYQVLIVEDDKEIRQYIAQELSTEFHVKECPNGKEAMNLIFAKTPPDLVISDIMMPEMDGLTLCRKIKQNININHIPVILLTAKTREEDNLEGLEMGADAYIMKPFSIEILKRTVTNLIRSREILKNNFTGNQEQEERLQKIDADSPDERLLDRVMKMINDNIGNPDLNVEMIAQEVGISRVHLHRKLKELTNQAPRELIKNLRLKQAAALLADKHRNITEVAIMTGFTSTTYFSTSFKELFGISPSAYMERYQKEENIEEKANSDKEEKAEK